MLELSYNLSLTLKDRLEKIDILRKDILLSPISPKTELQMRWDAMINRAYNSLALANSPLTKQETVKILTSSKAKFSREEEDALLYKKALDHISQKWLVPGKNVTVKDVLILYDIFCRGRLIIPPSRIQELLDYIQAHEQHPVIQAGVASLGITRIQPFSDGNGRLSRLLPYLFLYKNGFDVRGLIEFEKSWSQDKETYLQALKIGLEAASITLWLEYFSNSLLKELTLIFGKIKTHTPENLGIHSSFWDLSDRQKAILNIVENPGTSITNRKVQKQFNVSQITASRDLSKLANLRLLFSHGKGRSVYYTKV
ncbi:MAG: hypothetical protein A3B44_01065 [Candidatus Levybacteria bacterium RIFCSPLOWO2_01_FULL_38_21]|nr:MAG: hypothetical protein A3B44_01065 [Candidatus Levybacteria bacterium RIFCSPLOWO2_01_FULL_38_21]